MSALEIRSERRSDIGQVRDLNTRAFPTAAEAVLVDAIRDSDGAISLVAESDGVVMGHILFTRIRVDGAAASSRGAGLAPMAVLPDHQRAGVGSALVRSGLERCRAAGFAFVVVVGHPEYYQRFGFVPAGAYGLQCEFAVPPEVWMALELSPGALTDVQGVVRYLPEFANV